MKKFIAIIVAARRNRFGHRKEMLRERRGELLEVQYAGRGV